MGELWFQFRDSPIEVSDLGRVRSTTYVDKNGRGRVRMLKPFPNTTGYLMVNWRQDGRRHSALVHRLVLEVFVGPCPPGHESRHLDGSRSNNRIGNLAWGTPAENAQDKYHHGRGAQKLCVQQVEELDKLIRAGLTYRVIAQRFGISQPAVTAIARGRTWGHVTGRPRLGRAEPFRHSTGDEPCTDRRCRACFPPRKQRRLTPSQ